MLAMKQNEDWEEGLAARLGAQIRQSMTRMSGERPSQEDVVTIGRLIDQRIEDSFNRGLRAARAAKPSEQASSDR